MPDIFSFKAVFIQKLSKCFVLFWSVQSISGIVMCKAILVQQSKSSEHHRLQHQKQQLIFQKLGSKCPTKSEIL